MKIDLSSKNSSIGIVLLLDLLFFVAAIVSAMVPQLASISGKLWEMFVASNGALLLVLNSENRHVPPTPPGAPENPTQQ